MQMVWAVLTTFAVTSGAFWLFQDKVKNFLPGWKNKIIGWFTQAVGILLMSLAVMDPELLRPLLGETKWTGLALFALGQVIVHLRKVTWKVGDDV